jgi:hypothetical protein
MSTNAVYKTETRETKFLRVTFTEYQDNAVKLNAKTKERGAYPKSATWRGQEAANIWDAVTENGCRNLDAILCFLGVGVFAKRV